MTGLPGSIADAAALIRTRALSPLELARELLTRIQRFDPLLNAFLRVTETLALSQATDAEREIMAGRYRGPLHGIPLGLKDIYETAGIATTASEAARVITTTANTTMMRFAPIKGVTEKIGAASTPAKAASATPPA